MAPLVEPRPPDTERAHLQALQLLERHGVLTREATLGEQHPGGFAAVYGLLRALEERGHTVQMGGRQGSANAIGVNPRTGERMGAPDPRSADAGAVGVGAREGSR